MITKIRILHVLTDTNIGGAGKCLIYLLRCIDRERFDVSAVLPAGSMIAPKLDEIGIGHTEAEGIGEKSLSFAGIRTLRCIIKDEKPDIVHTHASMSARIAARLFGKCRIVSTRHSYFTQPKYKKRFPVKQVTGFLNNTLSDRIIAVSPAVRDDLAETGTDPSRIAVIYNGVDALEPLTEAEYNETRGLYGLSGDGFVCGIAARLEPYKGHEYLLRAAGLLKENYPDIKIIVAGTGSLESELKEKAASMGLTNCIFAGFVEDIRRFCGILDLQINASYGTEATSMALLEGMSLGIPSVVTDFGGNPYVIESGANGTVVPCRDHEALYGAIAELYENKALYGEMRRKSKEIFGRKFTVGAMAEHTQEVYADLAEGKG